MAEYLEARGGLDSGQIVVVGYGPHDPLDTTGTKSAKARNRRVEIVIGETL